MVPEERPLEPATGMETRREVIGAEGSAQRGTCLLQYDRSYEEEGQCYLHVRQRRLEGNHCWGGYQRG